MYITYYHNGKNMQFHPNEIYIYCDPSTSTGKQTIAMAKSISNNVNTHDWNKVKLTATLWKEVVNMLSLRPKDLLNKANKDYQQRVSGNTFTMNGWLDVLAKNPHMLKAPIAIFQGRAIQCIKPTDILKLDTSKPEKKVLPHLR